MQRELTGDRAMLRAASIAIALTLATASPAAPPQHPLAPAVEQYVAPYVDTRNFSGVILVAKRGAPQFQRAYGFADVARKVANGPDTRFHIASMSMQFTAAATLRLIKAGRLSLDTPVSAVLRNYPNGDAISIEQLLTQTSGIADINAQPDYAEILKAHQTPTSLVARMREVPRLRAPGTYEREEHSAYNLLALIIERKTGLPFAKALQQLVFAPLGMKHSGVDDDGPSARLNAAIGYQPQGLYAISPADRIRWSAKAGNGSAYTTAGDELKFVRGLSGGDFLSPALRDKMFDLGSRVGFGWFKSNSSRFGQPVYSMNGRAPGFASAVTYLPKEQLLVVALSNIYASVPAEMTTEIAALTLQQPYQRLSLQTKVDPASLGGLPAAFQFTKDFYQPGAIVQLAASDGTVTLHWPSGDTSVLIPTARDRLVDRNYWVPVEIVRDGSGHAQRLKYDRFFGERANG
jgi:CubicO group peptidase (beta-lactamase class C family)